MRVLHRADLHALIAGIFAELPAAEILDRLELADIACARRNSVEEFLDHPQLADRDSLAHGRLARSARCARCARRCGWRGSSRSWAAFPSLGQHSQPILEELGFDAATIAAWRKEQMI